MKIKTIFLGLGAIPLLILGWYIYTPAYQPVRSSYPLLSDMERHRMDLKLFNELSVVNEAWPPRKTFENRQSLIQNMGRQGFEVADLAYQLLNISPAISSGRHWLMPWERSAYHHLRRLADQGDPSAQCLTALVIQRWQLDMSDYERYVVQAAKAGQPYCTNILSGLLQITIGPKGPWPMPYWQTLPKDDRQGRALKLLAAKKGVQRAQLYLVSGYVRGIWGYPLSIGKAKCWFYLAKRADTGATLTAKTLFNWQIKQAEAKGLNVSEQYDPKQWCETKLIGTNINIGSRK